MEENDTAGKGFTAKQATKYMHIYEQFQANTTRIEAEYLKTTQSTKAAFESELQTARNTILILREQLKAGAKHIAPTVYAELDRLTNQNSVQKGEIAHLHQQLKKQHCTVAAELAKEKFKAMQQLNNIERELWKTKDQIHGKETQRELYNLNCEKQNTQSSN